MTSDKPKLKDMPNLDLFLEMQSAERGASKNTLSAYRQDLLDFQTYLEEKGNSAETAGEDDLSEFLNHLSEKGLAAGSMARKFSSLVGYYRFLVTENLRSDNPMQSMKRPKQPVLCLNFCLRQIPESCLRPPSVCRKKPRLIVMQNVEQSVCLKFFTRPACGLVK